MSRLIDADALKKTFCAECDHTISCEDCDIDFHFEHLAPTVEAIPIEWLEMRIAPLYWTVEGRKIQEVAYWLIDEWEEWKREKDNETD